MKFKCWKCGGTFRDNTIYGIPGVHRAWCVRCGCWGIVRFKPSSIMVEPVQTLSPTVETLSQATMSPFEQQLLGYMKEIIDRMPKQTMSTKEMGEAVNKYLKEFEERNSMEINPDIKPPKFDTVQYP